MKRILTHIVLIIGASGLLATLLFWALALYTRHGDVVTIPDIKGSRIEQVADILGHLDLDYEIVDSIYAPNSHPGTILECIPSIGSKVKRGRCLFLIVNTPTARNGAIPEVVDKSLRQTTTTLRAIGFKEIEVRYIPGIFKDLVKDITANGRPLRSGEMLPITTPIQLIVTDGMEGTMEEGTFDPDSVDTELYTGEPVGSF